MEQFLAVCRKWDVLATVIGEVTEGDRLTVDWHGERIVDVLPRTVAHEALVYDRPMRRPADLDDLQADDAANLPRPQTGPELQAQWLAVVSSPDGADKTWVTEQYDRYVRATRCSRSPRTPASCVSTRRPTAASRWPSTATPGTPASTPTPVRSSTWPRPTATWR